jgi:hypothetical protein
MPDEICEKARQIASLLDIDEHEAMAQDIRNAIDCGSTSSEIMMRLRHRLRGLQAAQTFKDDIERLKVSRLLSELELLLSDHSD